MQLSPKEQAQLARAACYENLDVFAAGAFSIINPGVQYKWNWHIDCICEYLQACYRGEIRRLIINMPPRALKSYLVSEVFGAWVLGREPHEQFIVASHTMRPLAVKLSNDTRRLMESEWYLSMFPGTKIDKSTENQLVTTKNGHRLAVSVGTGITGLGFNYGILDDPNKPDEALSDVIRNGTNDWIDNTFMSRMNDRLTGRIICVMQRVHEDDATGHLLEKTGYTHLKLPAEAPKPVYYKIDDKTFGMKTGDLLHEARLPPDVLEELRRDLGDYSFSGQYMQEPVPVGGGMFKMDWVQYFSVQDFDMKNCNVYILCDPAGVGDVPGANRRKKSDWTAFQVVALANDNNYYLLDMVRDKFNPTERVHALFNIHRKWNDLTGKSPKVGYESYGLQSDLHYIMQKQNDDSYRFPLIPLGGSMSKPDRIARLIPDMQNRRWYFPPKIDYTDTRGMRYDLVSEMLKGEMMTFPVSKHDDCCFVAGTLIATQRGSVPIELLKASDMVLTPDGYKKIIDHGFTGCRQTIEWLGLKGTPNHPIFTFDNGYVPLDTIYSVNDIVELSICDWIRVSLLKSLSSTVFGIEGWEEAVNIIYRSPQQMRDGKILRVCMSQFGSFIQAHQYRQAMKFIMSMKTHSIASLKILSAYRLQSIAQTMAGSARQLKEKILTALDLWLLHGILPLKELNGIGSTPSKQPERFLLKENINVFNAKVSSRQSVPVSLNTALISVANAPDTQSSRESTNTASFAKFAGKSIWRRKKVPNFALENVLTLQDGVRPVYNLTVADAKCYFANGVLVHNCDALSRIYDEDMQARFPKRVYDRRVLPGYETTIPKAKHWINL